MFPVVTVTHAGRRSPKAAKTVSVFKKIVMAVSGIIMLLFLIAHMIGNLHVFQGAESFNDYSEWLRSFGEPALPPRTLLTTIEVVLVVSVVAHMWAAISLWRQAKRARPEAYVTKKSVAQSYASRTMRWGGVIIAGFIVYHILDLTFGVANPDGTDSTPYDRLVASFQNPIATTVYVITLILLGHAPAARHLERHPDARPEQPAARAHGERRRDGLRRPPHRRVPRGAGGRRLRARGLRNRNAPSWLWNCSPSASRSPTRRPPWTCRSRSAGAPGASAAGWSTRRTAAR